MDELKQWMQNAFNTAYLGLIAQGKISRSPSVGCAYRGCNGTKCAVGWLIPDEAYNEEEMENLSAAFFFNNDYQTCRDFRDAIGLPTNLNQDQKGTARDFLCELQTAHDQLENQFRLDDSWLAWFKDSAIRIAKKYDLTVPDEPVPV